MRMMGFSITPRQMLERTKTVTRRAGWKYLEPGMRILAVLKVMGRRVGEPIRTFGVIEVVSVRREPVDLAHVTQAECDREGFPDKTPQQFVDLYLEKSKLGDDGLVARIEFKFVNRDDLTDKERCQIARYPPYVRKG